MNDYLDLSARSLSFNFVCMRHLAYSVVVFFLMWDDSEDGSG